MVPLPRLWRADRGGQLPTARALPSRARRTRRDRLGLDETKMGETAQKRRCRRTSLPLVRPLSALRRRGAEAALDAGVGNGGRRQAGTTHQGADCSEAWRSAKTARRRRPAPCARRLHDHRILDGRTGSADARGRVPRYRVRPLPVNALWLAQAPSRNPTPRGTDGHEPLRHRRDEVQASQETMHAQAKERKEVHELGAQGGDGDRIPSVTGRSMLEPPTERRRKWRATFSTIRSGKRA